MSPSEDREYDKVHEPTELHPIIDAVYNFARAHGGVFSSRPINGPSWQINWQSADVQRNVQIHVRQQSETREITVSGAAWHDDGENRKRFYRFTKSDLVLTFPIDVENLARSLAIAREEVMSLDRDDLTSVASLRK